jgi:hypothetical protein
VKAIAGPPGRTKGSIAAPFGCFLFYHAGRKKSRTFGVLLKEVAIMSKITTLALMVSVVLAPPVLGYWEYDGTTVTIGGPGSGSDPYGTWGWSAYASGSVYPSMDYLAATGYAYGYAWCELGTWDELGLQRSVYGTSRVEGTSSYHWVEDETPKEITVDVEVTVDYGEIYCEGEVVDYEGTSPTCYSDGYVLGGGSASSVINFYPYGYSYLTGSKSGFSGDNNWGGVEATTNELGYLVVSGDANDTYPGTPWGNSFSATAMVFGLAEARGKIVITGQPSSGGFYAGADYFISAGSSVSLSGNIDDRE